MTAYATLRVLPDLTFRRRITWLASGTPVDLDGMTVFATIYDRFGAAAMEADELGGVTLGGVAGTIDLFFSADDVAAAALSGMGTWRIRVIEASGDVRDLVAGPADFRADTTGPSNEQDLIIDERPGDVLILESAGQGPAGPAGPTGPGAGSTISLIANGAIGGHRIVVGDDAGKAEYADQTDPTQIGRVVGMSLGAAIDGAAVEIAVGGEITEPSWTWTPGPLWLGISGVPTQSAPSTGILQYIGTAITATKILIRIEIPIYLG